MLRKTYRVQSVRSVRTLPAHLYHRRDFERRKRVMRYICAILKKNTIISRLPEGIISCLIWLCISSTR